MTGPNTLRLDPELEAIGVQPDVIDALGARGETSVSGLHALRRGIIDAARIGEGAPLTTPDAVRESKEYSIGLDAATSVIVERVERSAA